MYSQEHSLPTQLFLAAEQHVEVASGRVVPVSVISVPWELTRNAEFQVLLEPPGSCMLASPGRMGGGRGEGEGGGGCEHCLL